jgi:hypothetical protein|tara:strand:- start:1166 stop:1336 length:171 start_codon:yes stop_codon:yes gene_type:complete
MVDVDVESNAVAFLLVDGRVFSLDVRSRVVVREGGNGDTQSTWVRERRDKIGGRKR